jgi:hypothetical protein
MLPGSVARDDEEFVIPIREYAPLCLGEGLRRGKTIEVGRGSAPQKIYHTYFCEIIAPEWTTRDGTHCAGPTAP